MKALITFAVIFFALNGFGQSPEEAQVLTLSGDIFKWETENKIDLLENIFSDKFVLVNSAGINQTKDQYLTLLRSGNFVHDSIRVEKNMATVVDNTATVVGKGKFIVTHSGKRMTLILSYLEVFTRPNIDQGWKILAMHASILQN
jgi:Domain of unknown function (DUF4440)